MSAHVEQMPPSPESNRLLLTVVCRECGIEEGMYDDTIDGDRAAQAHAKKHDEDVHTRAEQSVCLHCGEPIGQDYAGWFHWAWWLPFRFRAPLVWCRDRQHRAEPEPMRKETTMTDERDAVERLRSEISDDGRSWGTIPDPRDVAEVLERLEAGEKERDLAWATASNFDTALTRASDRVITLRVERDEARAERDAANAVVEKVDAFARQRAIAMHGLGHLDRERDFLDISAILERPFTALAARDARIAADARVSALKEAAAIVSEMERAWIDHERGTLVTKLDVMAALRARASVQGGNTDD